tara:strand:- start:26102 stop:26536 length:435 start_codon:yes stop_codon:yes gene_type:complete
MKIKILIFSLIFSFSFSPAIAGEKLPKGYTLNVDSYVFTIDEATRLMERIKYLEKIEKELVEQKKLVVIQGRQIDLFKLNEQHKNDQIKYYSDLAGINHKLLKKYEDRSDINSWTKMGYLTLGVAITVGAFILAGSVIDGTGSN